MITKYEVFITNPDKDVVGKSLGLVNSVKDAVRIADFYSEKLPQVVCTYRSIDVPK